MFVPVLRCIVFILVLDNEPLAGEVIGLALAPPPELDLQDIRGEILADETLISWQRTLLTNLVPLEVSLVFDNLDERHLDFSKISESTE